MERDHGLALPRWLQVELAQLVQKVSEERGGEVDSAAIYRVFAENFIADGAPAALAGYRLERNGGHDVIVAHVVENGTQHRLRGEGDGAIAAFVDAWRAFAGQRVNVIDYSEHAVGSGTDAEAAAYVQLNVDGVRISGAALDRDTVSASLKAVLAALNRVRVRREVAA